MNAVTAAILPSVRVSTSMTQGRKSSASARYR